MNLNSTTQVRKCSKCGVLKLLSDFYLRSSKTMPARHRSERKSCTLYATRTRTQTPEGKEIRRAYLKLYSTNLANHSKIKAATLRYSRTEKGKRLNKNSFLIRHYGITLKEYEDRFKEQLGLCYICGGNERRKLGDQWYLNVDHNHRTGAMRHLLCSKCNFGLGLFRDSSFLLRRAASMLDEHRA